MVAWFLHILIVTARLEREKRITKGLMKTILLTGATRGLGLAIARALDEMPDVCLVLAEVVRLDVALLADVALFAANWDRGRSSLW